MTVRIAFRVGDTRLLARLIHLWDRTIVSHVEVASAWEHAAHSCISASALDGGVRRKTLEFTPDKWRVYEVDADPLQVENWYDLRAGQGYDFFGLLGFVFRPYKGMSKRWFCSEAVASAVGLAEPWRFTPRSLEVMCEKFGKRVI